MGEEAKQMEEYEMNGPKKAYSKYTSECVSVCVCVSMSPRVTMSLYVHSSVSVSVYVHVPLCMYVCVE